MLKSYINSFSLKALYAQTKQSSPVSIDAHSIFHLVYRMEPLLDRFQRRCQTKEKTSDQNELTFTV
jgi:hypothetical protein